MRIEKVHIQNLRAAKDLEVSLDAVTALVGANGSGKSTILLALRVFFGEAAVSVGDYHNENTAEDIAITATFGGLGPAACAQFSGYVGDDGRLKVSCIVHWDGSRAVRTLHGYAPRNPDFAAVLSETREAVAKPLYEALAARPDYAGLPLPWPGIQEAAEALRKWEDGHPDQCRRMLDGGQFFGPGVDGHARLSHFVRFLHVPAVYDASEDAGEGANSALGALLDITIQKILGEKEEYKALPGKIKKACKEAMDSNQSEILRLGSTLSRTLRGLVPGTQIEILGRPPEPSIGRPRFDVYLNENEYPSPVAGAGHGLQRALVIAVLHHLSRAKADGESYANMAYRHPAHSEEARAAASSASASAGDVRDASTVVLAIEEPELYQHPTRMRHLARLLQSLPCEGLAGAPGPVQAVYTTHSPHFVFADQIGQIRLVRTRYGRPTDPGTTAVASATQSDILEDLRRCGATLESEGAAVDYFLLNAMGPAVSEGFFSRAVVLVEGPSDRIVIEAAAAAMGTPLDSLGVSVVPCEAKSAMPLPIVVFRRFGIPVYAVWDADEDRGGQRAESGRIASALGHTGDDWRGRICGTFACLEDNLEATVASDLGKALGPPGDAGPHHKRILRERRIRHGIRKKDSKTLNARLLMEEVKEKDIRLETIGAIVREIAALAEGGRGVAPA